MEYLNRLKETVLVNIIPQSVHSLTETTSIYEFKEDTMQLIQDLGEAAGL